MAIISGSEATIAVGTTTAATTQSEYEGDTYNAIEQVTEFGPLGDVRNIIEYNTLADGRVQKARGVANGGDVTCRFAFDPAAPTGQAALLTAYEAGQGADEYNFRVQYDDQITAGSAGNPTTIYFRAKVSQWERQPVTADNIVEIVATLAKVTAEVVVDAT